MINLRVIIVLVCFFAFASIAEAAVISGSVYDLSLRKANNAIVEINSTPKQVMVAQNGGYSFNVPNGFYSINAKIKERNEIVAFVEENISIRQDGRYVLDLILFPDVEEGVDEIDIDVNGDIVDKKTFEPVVVVILAILGVAVIAFLILYLFRRKAKNEEEVPVKAEQKEIKTSVKSENDEIEKIVEIIKQEGGRTTQKEIRKRLPVSEAKISLLIAELEHKGIVDKIKKGRGNIIILKQK